MITMKRCGALVIGIAILCAAPLLGGVREAIGVECPPGQTAVEDIASGKVQCEGGDILDTTTLRPKSMIPGAPGRPEAPGRPAAPGKPGLAKRVSPRSAKSCAIARWGCQESCQKSYLASATGTSSRASQRAKVALGSCLRICGKKFACKAKPPVSP